LLIFYSPYSTYALKDEFLLAVENFGYIFCFLAITSKPYYFIYANRKVILDVIKKLDEFFPHHSLDQHKFQVQKRLKDIKRFSYIIMAIFFFFGLHLMAFPFERQIFSATETVGWEFTLVSYVPFEINHWTQFFTLHAVEAWLLLFSSMLIAFTDLLYATLLNLVSMEFEILGELISEIDLEQGNEEAIKELKKYVKIQQELIKVTETFEKIFFTPLAHQSLLFY
jgi:hypothetical protein